MDAFLQVLNDARLADDVAMMALTRHRVVCNERLARMPFVPVVESGHSGAHSVYEVSMLGILNGILGRLNIPPVAAVYNYEMQKLVRFTPYIK